MSKSTEKNADIFAAFTTLAGIEQQLGNNGEASQRTTRANVAGDFVARRKSPRPWLPILLEI
jgi:hypothetical protein